MPGRRRNHAAGRRARAGGADFFEDLDEGTDSRSVPVHFFGDWKRMGLRTSRYGSKDWRSGVGVFAEKFGSGVRDSGSSLPAMDGPRKSGPFRGKSFGGLAMRTLVLQASVTGMRERSARFPEADRLSRDGKRDVNQIELCRAAIVPGEGFVDGAAFLRFTNTSGRSQPEMCIRWCICEARGEGAADEPVPSMVTREMRCGDIESFQFLAVSC